MSKYKPEYPELDYENEVVLLANFIEGRHLEDMDMFDENLFCYKTLFIDIKKGLSIAEIASNMRINDNEMYQIDLRNVLMYGDETDPTFNYYISRGEVLNQQLNCYANILREAPAEERQKWIEKITETNTNIHRQDGIKRASNLKENFFSELESRESESNPRYGIKDLDKYTEGLHRGQLVTLSARPGQGKSALSLQIARNVVNAGYKVLYLPLEMTEYETLQRLIVQEQVVYDFNEAKHPTETQKQDIGDYLERVEREQLFCIYYGLNDLGSIEKVVKDEKPFLVVVDQLTQVDPGTRTKDIREKYIKVTSTLKKIALQENVCILALAQLNREAENKNTPGIGNLAESDSIGQDSDVVLIIKADDEEDGKVLRRVKLIIDKNRQGETNKKIDLMFHGSRCTFNTVEKNSSDGSKFIDAYKRL